MNHFRYYTVAGGLRLMSAGLMIAFFPRMLPHLEGLIAASTNDPSFDLPAILLELNSLFFLAGTTYFVMGAFRFAIALPDAIGRESRDVATTAERDDPQQARATVTVNPFAVSPDTATVDPSDERLVNPFAAPAGKSSAQRLVERWNRSRVRHLEVKDAYADIVTDPLNALTHSVLFDVSDARTQAFILAYAHADELFDYNDTRDRAAAPVAEYENAVLLLPTRWEDALRYAEKVGSGWLPEADAKLASTAANLIQRARATASEAESVLSWKRAKEHIDQIRSFNLPIGAVDALEQRVRGQLEVAQA